MHWPNGFVVRLLPNHYHFTISYQLRFLKESYFMHAFKLLASVSLGAAVLAGCSSTPIADKAATETRAAAPVTTADSRTVAPVNVAIDPLNDPKGALAKRSVYFDYDSYIVRAGDKPTVETHAKYLTANKGRKITIQGNTDERGGSEYNLALGQKRAEAVRKSLALMGVSDSQMEAVSFGKEKPKAAGHDEASWTENRRADIAY